MVLVALLGLAILALLPTPSALGVAKGVHIDPESPAGKEYALPLDQARNEAAGKNAPGDGDSVEPAPLFGEGVSGPGEAGGVPSGPGGQGDKPHGGGGQGGSPGPATGGGQKLAAARLLAGDDGYSATSGILLVAAIVAVGAAIGLGLRGFQRVRTS